MPAPSNYEFTTEFKKIKIVYGVDYNLVYCYDDGVETESSMSTITNYITESDFVFTIVDRTIEYVFVNFDLNWSVVIGESSYLGNYDSLGYNSILGDNLGVVSGNGSLLDIVPLSLSGSGSVDCSSILSELNNLHEDIVSLDTKFSAVTVSLQSLSGNGCEFKHASEVLVNGRDTIYTVESSFFFLLDDNTYTVLYNLKSPTGETLNCPETLLTRYVEPVVTTP